MSVRAKFWVQSNKKEGESENEGCTIILHPVVGNSEDNKSFYKWTPAGYITLTTINPEAAKQFIEGKEYYVDFSLAGE